MVVSGAQSLRVGASRGDRALGPGDRALGGELRCHRPRRGLDRLKRDARMRGCGGPRLTMRPYGEPVGSGGEDRQAKRLRQILRYALR